MQTITLRQELIDRLVGLNKKQKFLLSDDTTDIDWSNLKVDIQQSLDKLKKSAKVYEILAYIMMAVIFVIAVIRVLGIDGGPDLNKGALFILLTVSNMASALSYRLRVERLEKQVLLLDLLAKVDDKNE